MNSSNKATGAGVVWCWRRWIVATHQDLWVERLQEKEGLFWAVAEKVGRSRLLLSAYPGSRVEAEALAQQWGGRVRTEQADGWIKASASPPLKIGNKFIVVGENVATAIKGDLPRLKIPHGMAFGSGEHGTTFMLLRALARHEVAGKKVLDLGTGSGVLALAARLLGAKKIVATDFDAVAVRTARENEAMNFAEPAIRWTCADVKKLRAVSRYDLVLANLFSGILIEAAEQIAASVAPGGQLWLSGILRSQEREVAGAYRRQKLKLIRSVSRGKWVMLQWQKAG